MNVIQKSLFSFSKRSALSLCLFVMLFFASSHVIAQSLGDYRAISSGNWTTLTTWQYYNGVTWIAAIEYPGQTGGTATNDVTIDGGYTVTITTNLVSAESINSVTVGGGSGGTLSIGSTAGFNTPLLTLANGGTMLWTSNVSFYLPADAAIVIDAGGDLDNSGPCNASKRLIIGSIRISSCNGGAGAAYSFDEISSGGGSINVTPTSNEPICEGETLNLFANPGGAGAGDGTNTYSWTGPGSFTSTLENPTITGLTAGTYTYEVTITNQSTYTNTNSVDVSVTASPTITSTIDGSRCGTGAVTLGATASAGTINWYSAATGGASLASGVSFTTPSISTTTMYYVDATDNGCTTGTRTAVTATVQPEPNAGTNGTLTICSNDTLTTALLFAELGGSPDTGGSWSPALSGAGTYTYTVAATAPCVIDDTATIEVSVTDVNYSISSIDPSSCPGSNGLIIISDLTPSTVYSVSYLDDGSGIGPTSFTTNGSGQFAITGLDGGNYTNITVSLLACTSNTSSVTLTDPTAPATPSSGGNQTYCEGSAISPITASVGAGETVDWYDANTGGTLLLSGNTSYTPTGPGTYYAEARNNTTGCVSAARVAITITEQAAPDAGTNGTLTICVGDTVTAAQLFAELGGSPEIGGTWSPALAGGDTYTYTVAPTSPCTVAGTATVTVTEQAPAPPTSGGDITECEQSPIQTLTAVATPPGGSSLFWYDAMTGGSIVASPTLSSIGTITYYAESEDALGCISAVRTPVTLTIETCIADLSLTKTVDNATPNVGDTITFTLTVTNSGPFDVSGVQIQDVLPGGLINIMPSTGTGTYATGTGIWDLSTVLVNGGSATLTISAEISPQCGTITNTAEIISSGFTDPDSTPNNGG